MISATGLTMRYGQVAVLNELDLTVDRGEVVALLGPNGAGKTTTVEIMEGFRPRSAGVVSVLGSDPAHGADAWRARMGIVLQSWRDHTKWRVRDLLSYQAQLYAPFVPEPWSIEELLGAVDLSEHAHRAIKNLSGGQRRRLDLAIGLSGRPELLFLDEPTASLDPEARRNFHALVRRAVGEIGTTVLLTTHDLWEAEALATRIVILVRGRIIASGTRDDLTSQMAGQDHVSYTLDGQRHHRDVTDGTEFVRSLLATHDHSVTELEVARASLEDAYLAHVSAAERDPGHEETA